MNKNKVIYFHINPLTNEIFYVGIGSKKRASDIRERNSYWHDIVDQFGVIVDIVEEDLTWQEACDKERFYIKCIGRKDKGKGTLVNLTDGGNGNVNVSVETRNKLSKINSGKKHTQETKDKIAKSNSGKKHTQETKDKIAKIHTGKKHTKETKDKMSKSHKGKPGRPHTQEYKDKMSKLKTGKNFTQEHKDNLSAAAKGKKRGPYKNKKDI